MAWRKMFALYYAYYYSHTHTHTQNHATSICSIAYTFIYMRLKSQPELNEWNFTHWSLNAAAVTHKEWSENFSFHCDTHRQVYLFQSNPDWRHVSVCYSCFVCCVHCLLFYHAKFDYVERICLLLNAPWCCHDTMLWRIMFFWGLAFLLCYIHISYDIKYGINEWNIFRVECNDTNMPFKLE